MDFELSEEHRMLKDLVQKFVRDEKQTITQVLGGASVVRFGLIVIGG